MEISRYQSHLVEEPRNSSAIASTQVPIRVVQVKDKALISMTPQESSNFGQRSEERNLPFRRTAQLDTLSQVGDHSPSAIDIYSSEEQNGGTILSLPPRSRKNEDNESSKQDQDLAKVPTLLQGYGIEYNVAPCQNAMDNQDDSSILLSSETRCAPRLTESSE